MLAKDILKIARGKRSLCFFENTVEDRQSKIAIIGREKVAYSDTGKAFYMPGEFLTDIRRIAKEDKNALVEVSAHGLLTCGRFALATLSRVDNPQGQDWQAWEELPLARMLELARLSGIVSEHKSAECAFQDDKAFLLAGGNRAVMLPGFHGIKVPALSMAILERINRHKKELAGLFVERLENPGIVANYGQYRMRFKLVNGQEIVCPWTVTGIKPLQFDNFKGLFEKAKQSPCYILTMGEESRQGLGLAHTVEILPNYTAEFLKDAYMQRGQVVYTSRDCMLSPCHGQKRIKLPVTVLASTILHQMEYFPDCAFTIRDVEGFQNGQEWRFLFAAESLETGAVYIYAGRATDYS